MSVDKPLYGLALLILLVITYQEGYSQDYSKDQIDKILILDQRLSQFHVEYQKVRPHLSERIPGLWKNLLDPESKLLTCEDAKRLESFLEIDSLLEINTLKVMLDSSFALINGRYLYYIDFLKSLPKQNFFTQDSIFYQWRGQEDYCAQSQEKLDKFWVKKMKLSVLNQTRKDSIIQLEDSKKNERLNASLAKLIGAELCLLESQLNNLEEFVLHCFLSAYANCFDPHTDFIPAKKQFEFIHSLSSQQFSSGLDLTYKNGRLIIQNIIPLSDASRQELIAIGDEVMSVENQGELKPVVCVEEGELKEFFWGNTSDSLKLEIKSSKDQVTRAFSLRKTWIENEANHTYHFLLKNNELRLGYIAFPSFYMDGIGGAHSSGQDMARIVLKMKKMSIDGLVIDLRNNGGGSIQEAIDLSGFFIDYGPLFLVTDKFQTNGSLKKDMKKGKVYDGKVIFLVNSFSASASELVVNAMKHYPNQLIVGAQTYGKSTGQNLIPLLHEGRQEPFGLAKITTMKMYGINGTSYQSTGVYPDIHLPMFPSRKIVGEDKQPFALKNTRKLHKSFRPRTTRQVPVAVLREKFEKRKQVNNLFDQIANYRDSVENVMMEGFHVSLHFDQYDLFDQDREYKEKNPMYEVTHWEQKENFILESNRLIGVLEKDPYLNEVFRIFYDWNSIDENEQNK